MSSVAPWQPDLYAYDFENDPVPTITRLRAEDPVHWSRHGYWYLTRYEDVALVLKDTTRFSSAGAGFGNDNFLGRTDKSFDPREDVRGERLTGRLLARSFNQMDPPDHTRIRRLINAAFSLRNVMERHDRIVAVVDQVLNEAAAKGRFDLVTDVAFHIPIIVSSEMIGIPTTDLPAFREAFAAAEALMEPKQSEQRWADGMAASRWIVRYLHDVITERRSMPQRDLISDLLSVEEAGDRLTDTELLSAIATIYTAAATTTERFVSSGLFLLLSHPEQWRALVRDRGLMQTACDEILRFHHPTQSTSTNRRCTVDVELRGKTLRAGDAVRLGLGGANRDPEVFPDPDRFFISRKPLVSHLALGRGAHFCIGAPLARFIGQLVFNRVMDRWPHLQLITTAPVKDPARLDRYREIIVQP